MGVCKSPFKNGSVQDSFLARFSWTSLGSRVSCDGFGPRITIGLLCAAIILIIFMCCCCCFRLQFWKRRNAVADDVEAESVKTPSSGMTTVHASIEDNYEPEPLPEFFEIDQLQLSVSTEGEPKSGIEPSDITEAVHVDMAPGNEQLVEAIVYPKPKRLQTLDWEEFDRTPSQEAAREAVEEYRKQTVQGTLQSYVEKLCLEYLAEDPAADSDSSTPEAKINTTAVIAHSSFTESQGPMESVSNHGKSPEPAKKTVKKRNQVERTKTQSWQLV
ncbi:hypothetical protein L596_000339 [Steinernema carpocapsae]|uniref:Uncharacterized protein n=1 Tax=Steinernema carpocapsae TaxID=34508 RepID=A0A4U8UJ87_STECR|nr:hypothetical protein L596_000339 [Steinernema carpocapsae]